MIETLSEERRQKIDPKDPDALRRSIIGAIEDLRARSALQQQWVQEIMPVVRLVAEIGHAIEGLRMMGEEIPTIDLTDIDPSFLDCFGLVQIPEMQHIARMLDQQREKVRLLAKWGNRPEWLQTKGKLIGAKQ
ncbi:MAG: hypothetical protein PHO20_03635 [Candidatus Peribacteraceae bacterium]|nr:hypothetical protein [Candidatus Peribacteraceae bacterium]MDD5739832.1 hypothetical protein [Candidatus Peribacteraceae bacterium]